MVVITVYCFIFDHVATYGCASDVRMIDENFSLISSVILFFLQYNGQTDTELRAAIAEALNRYCNVNASRRAECGLPE